MEEEKKEEPKENIPKKKINLTEKTRENPWILSSLVLGVLVVILLVTTFSGSLTGNVSKEKAADNLVSYAEAQGIQVSVNGVTEEAGLYNLNVDINGKATNVYLTKDGKNIINGLIPLIASSSDASANTQTTEVPKTTKPSVELYVFTYCPYGLQMEKAMIPVVKLLGNSIDFRIRQIGAMHGEYEKTEAKRQLCIEKNYPSKFLDYVLAFAEDTSCTNGADACVATKTNALFSKFGIDASKINSCMASEGAALYEAEVSNANTKSVSGSPTLIINGINSQAARSPEAVKGAICEAFSEVPSSCTQTLSTSQASAGFGSGTSSSSSRSTTSRISLTSSMTCCSTATQRGRGKRSRTTNVFAVQHRGQRGSRPASPCDPRV